MKVIAIAAAGVSLVLIALTLAPAAVDYRSYCAIGALVCAIVTLALIAAGWRERSAPVVVSRPAEPLVRPASAGVAPPPAESRTSTGQAEVVGFLASLQEKGRLVDFLQDDIAAYSDAQVGAAARVVHQGCKAVLNESVRIVPIRDEQEGAQITVPADYDADEYRLVGKLSGPAPFSGTLMHRGWKVESVRLPRMLQITADRLPAIAPAEVEVR